MLKKATLITTVIASTLLATSSLLFAATTFQPVDAKKLTTHHASLAPYQLKYNETQLTAGEKAFMQKMVEAGRLIDQIFMNQTSTTSWQMFKQLQSQYEQQPNDVNRTLLEYFWINKGPYDQLDTEAYKPFVTGAPKFHPNRNFYPVDMTQDEFNQWVTTLSPNDAALAKSDFSAIRRASDGKLQAVPYSQAYAEWLQPLANLFDAAAKDVAGTSLATFLKARAEAFRTNNYENSEALWIDMNGKNDKKPSHIDLTVGPYENYADELMKRKAGFQFYLGVLQPEKTAALQVYSKYAHKMDEELWQTLQRYYKNGAELAPGKRLSSTQKIHRWATPGDKITLVAIDLAYSAGMANEGKQTLAYNLPNVESWTEKYGTKKVMMINMIEGKFDLILAPMAKLVLNKTDLAYIDGSMFSDNTVRHEVAHGIGPGMIQVANDKGGMTSVAVRERLQQTYSAFEEAKAEIVSQLFGYYLLKNKVFSSDAAFNDNFAKRMATNYVVSAFRTIRFGVTSDHAKGKIFEFNRLAQNGAITFKNGRYEINFEKFPEAVEKLAMEIIDLQMHGSIETAKQLLDTVGKPTPELLSVLRQIDDPTRSEKIPVDLRVSYTFGDNFSVIPKRK